MWGVRVRVQVFGIGLFWGVRARVNMAPAPNPTPAAMTLQAKRLRDHLKALGIKTPVRTITKVWREDYRACREYMEAVASAKLTPEQEGTMRGHGYTVTNYGTFTLVSGY